MDATDAVGGMDAVGGVGTAPDDTQPARDRADAEQTEAEFMYALESQAPDAVKDELGIATHRVAGGVVLAMRHDPAGGYWNKALGFGVSEPFTAQVARTVVDLWREHGTTAGSLQVAPSALPPDWSEIAARLGLTPGSVWVKLLRPASAAPSAATDLRVGPVTEEHALEWADVFCTGFGMPVGPLSRMLAAVVGRDGFHPLAAWAGERVVAGANLFLSGDRASFCGAATLPEARGRGAQSRFFVERVETARRAGCRVMVAETWAEGDGQHNPSLHNLRRAGFQDLYLRQNWVWRAPSR
jgi:ribosomal protein S18 acetylase RimI-like enzyme